MKSKNVECGVNTGDNLYGAYANAFRVMVDGPDAILDFCVYSEQDNSAVVVSRIRVPPNFLEVVLERLQQALTLRETPSNSRIYLMPELEGDN
mgnify:FL=1